MWKFLKKELIHTNIYGSIIPRNVRLGESPSFGETIVIHDVASKGAINYLNLANELLQKLTITK